MSLATVLAVVALAAAAYLWREVRRLKRALHVQPTPPVEPAPLDQVTQRLDVLERSDRRRELTDLLR